jgi:CRISPR-associated protein Cmx8
MTPDSDFSRSRIMPVKNDIPESVSLTYRLADLPTAQHKAGLAGLLLLIRNLGERKVLGHAIGELPEVEQLSSDQATLRVTLAGLQTLFDDLYDAEFIKTKKGKDFPKPTGNFLRHWLGDGHDIWTKQFADALTTVIYSKPTTWNPFKERAGKKPVPKAKEIYKQLATQPGEEKASQKVKGQHFIGAGEENAERVGFATTPRLFLVLHFWILVSPIFAPRTLKEERDAVSGERYLEARIDTKEPSFLIAVPEPSDLEVFLGEMRDYWRQLSPDTAEFRPAEAVIDVPAEGGLEFLLLLARDMADTATANLPVAGVELYLLFKKGNNVNLLTAQHLRPNPAMLAEYELHLHEGRSNPLFKRLAIDNLITGRPWYVAAQSVLARYDANAFIGRPVKAGFHPFGYDVRRRFKTLIEQLTLLERHRESPMTETLQTQQDDALARRIYQMIGTYVRVRTKEKCGKDITDLPEGEDGHPVYTTEYRDARQKVAKEAFLSLRGRREGDIAEYFTGSLCGVPQFLKEDDFIALGRALLEKPDKVKDLAMLALSAHAWLPGQKADDTAVADPAE